MHIIKDATYAYIFFNKKDKTICIFQQLKLHVGGGGVPANFSRGRAVRLLGPYHP